MYFIYLYTLYSVIEMIFLVFTALILMNTQQSKLILSEKKLSKRPINICFCTNNSILILITSTLHTDNEFLRRTPELLLKISVEMRMRIKPGCFH